MIMASVIEGPKLAMKARTTSTSLFQQCQQLYDRLSSIPNYSKRFIQPFHAVPDQSSTTGSPSNFQILWNSFRQGASLCFLLELYSPNSIENVNDLPRDMHLLDYTAFTTNDCKANVYKVLVASRQKLGLQESELFSLSELYRDETQGFIKVSRISALRLILILFNRYFVQWKSFSKSLNQLG